MKAESAAPGHHVRYLMRRLADGHGAYTQEIVDCWAHDLRRDLPPDFPEIRVAPDPLRRDTYVVSFIRADGIQIGAAAAGAAAAADPAGLLRDHVRGLPDPLMENVMNETAPPTPPDEFPLASKALLPLARYPTPDGRWISLYKVAWAPQDAPAALFFDGQLSPLHEGTLSAGEVLPVLARALQDAMPQRSA